MNADERKALRRLVLHLLWSVSLDETRGDAEETAERFAEMFGVIVPGYEYNVGEWRAWIGAQGLSDENVGVFSKDASEVAARLKLSTQGEDA